MSQISVLDADKFTKRGEQAWIVDADISANAAIATSKIAQRVLSVYPIPMTAWRVHDALQTNLPGTAATDDLAVIGGTFGTAVPVIQTSDAKATSVTQRARCHLHVPSYYEAGETIILRFKAGMITTISDGTATLDAEVYLSDLYGAVNGSDLVTTAATTINSLTEADIDFTITGSGLSGGDELDVRITIAITDSATGTAVTGQIGSAALLCDTR